MKGDHDGLATASQKLRTEKENFDAAIRSMAEVVNALPEVWEGESLNTAYTDTENTNDESGNSQLFFDPDDVLNRTVEYSALSDVYGWSVFTEDFEKRETKLKEQKQAEKDSIFHMIMTNENSDDEFDSIFIKVMSTKDSQIVKNDIKRQEKAAGVTITGAILMSILMVCFCFFMMLHIIEGDSLYFDGCLMTFFRGMIGP